MGKTYLGDVISFLEGNAPYRVPSVSRVSETVTVIGAIGRSRDFVNYIVYRHDQDVFVVDTDPFRGTPERIEVDCNHPWYETISLWLMQARIEQ